MPPVRLRLVLQALAVRLRFPLLLLGAVLLVAAWPWLRDFADRLGRPGPGIDGSVSLDTEYWCPMCPGVSSDWPGKCPVCSMTLVRRKKGEATPLPDGVVARMQLSPYRVQLAGIRTTPVEYRPLEWEATFGGVIEPADSSKRFHLPIDVPEIDLACVRPGITAEITSEAFPGQTFPGRVRDLGKQVAPDTRMLPVRVEVEDTRDELRPGMFVTARLHVPLAQLDSTTRHEREEWANRTAVELAVRSLPACAAPAPGLESLLEAGGREVLYCRGLTLAVPTSAVIDTGERKVVFIERMPGMFDGVEVTLGRRSGDWHPVLGGLEPGQQVVTAGAFLLDAETRLNPSLAAGYFGASGKSNRTSGSPTEGTPGASPTEEQQLIAKQKICPVTEAPLGSMGAPVRVVIDGKPVFICCKGCEKALRANPKKYLEKLSAK